MFSNKTKFSIYFFKITPNKCFFMFSCTMYNHMLSHKMGNLIAEIPQILLV